MSTTSRAYIVQSLFNTLVLSVSKDGAALVHKSGNSYDVNRKEAANLLRYARAKNGLINKIKSLPIA